MACRGYFLALDKSCTARLLAASGDDAWLIETIQELDMTDAPEVCSVDKAWDGIHRCLTEGELGMDDGTYPLNAVILGGRSMHQGKGYLVSYNTPGGVRDIAAALTGLDLEPFAARHWALDPEDYGAHVDQDGLDYLTGHLRGITAFYQRAAHAGWATVFVADQ